MLSRSHVSWNCVSGAVLRFLRWGHCLVFFLFLCLCSLPVSLFLCLLSFLWCIDFWRSISSLTDLRPVGDKIDLKKSMHHKATATTHKDTGKGHNHKNNKKNKTISLEEPWTQFQKHNSKKRVIEKASHCLCHLVSFGRQRDQLCTANCLTSKLYENKTHPGGQRLRPHPGPWPSNKAQCSWSNEVGTRAGRQGAAAAVARQQ